MLEPQLYPVILNEFSSNTAIHFGKTWFINWLGSSDFYYQLPCPLSFLFSLALQ